MIELFQRLVFDGQQGVVGIWGKRYYGWRDCTITSALLYFSVGCLEPFYLDNRTESPLCVRCTMLYEARFYDTDTVVI